MEGKKRIVVYGAFVLLGVFLTVITFTLWGYNQELKAREMAEAQKKALAEKEKKILERKGVKEEAFSDLQLEAKGAYLFDVDGKEELFAKNKDKKLGIASLTKIASADVALEDVNNVDRKFVISRADLKVEGNDGLILGEEFDLKDLITYMMTVSSNDLAHALTQFSSSRDFLDRMNSLAERLGLKSTIFFSPSGLDISNEIFGSYSTAEDMAKLVKYFQEKYPKLSQNFSQKNNRICSSYLCREIENTNRLLGENFPYEVLFSKTGYTERSGGSLAMIVKIKGHKILAVVLASTKEGRFSDMEKLLRTTEAYFNALEKLR